MVEYFAQIIASLLSVVLMGFGSLSSPGPSTTIDIPMPTEAPVVASEARYPTHALWDMPYGITPGEVLALIEEKTGQASEMGDDNASLTLYGADNIQALGYPVDIFAYFSEPYNKTDAGPILSSISFDLNISGKDNFGLRQPVASRDSTRQVAAGIIPRIDEITASAIEEFGPLTESEVAVWKESDSELEYVDTPITLDGDLDTDQLLDIVTTYQTMLFYLYFDNVDVMFYTAFEDGYETYYVLSPSVRYSYYDSVY